MFGFFELGHSDTANRHREWAVLTGTMAADGGHTSCESRGVIVVQFGRKAFKSKRSVETTRRRNRADDAM